MVDDRIYWNKFYDKTHTNLQEPSLFARFVYENYLKDKKGAKLVEFGCGNGRDSLYFIKNGINVVGIDGSNVTIENLSKIAMGGGTSKFICADFTKNLDLEDFDFCYSRFTLHAINDCGEEALFKNAAKILKNDGLFFIEARSINDGKFGFGKALGEREFILDDHYRRFIDKDILKNNLQKYNFNILKLEESSEFAPIKGENCVCLRAIVKLK